ncbi:hypothetical protein HQ563_12160 [bacterium]|nr:hypothetical protein [bacterium]
MKDLESKLKKLPLVAPSPDLDDRVSAQKTGRPVRRFPERRGVPVWVTGAVALIMAVVGFAVGASRRGEQPHRRPGRERRPPVRLHVIYNSPSSGNPFDFTRASDMFPAGKMETTTQTQKGA